MAVGQAKAPKVNGKYDTDSFFPFYMHLMLNSLRLASKKFKDYGETVLALDARGGNWRKDIFPDYKRRRKSSRDESDIDFDSFYERVNEFVEVLGSIFPYKVVHVEKAEGDDVIGVLAKKYAPIEKTVVVTSDKDMKQVLEYGCDLFDPIKMKFIKMSDEELKKWKIEHILCGDDGDDIPHIKRGTQFTDNFISFLRNKDIHVKTVQEFEQLAISQKLYDEYDVWKETKKDGKFKDIFKPTPFGPSGAEKFAKDLAENLKSNPLYIKHFKRNKELVLFEHIPDWLQENIIKEYESIEMTHNINEIFQFLTKNSLTKLVMDLSDFDKGKSQNLGSVSDWV